MKCPLKFRLQDITSEKDRIYTGDCLKEECAWWGAIIGQCCVFVIAANIAGIHYWLDKLVQKMPHLEQFKR